MTNELTDMNQLRGMGCAKRVVEIAASGEHSLVVVGDPGQGKSTLIRLGRGLVDVEVGRYLKWYETQRAEVDDEWVTEHDLFVDVPRLGAADWALPPPAESSDDIRGRVTKVREVALRADCAPLLPDSTGVKLMVVAYERLHMSPRRADAVVRVAATLALMDNLKAKCSLRIHVAEALSYVHVPKG